MRSVKDRLAERNDPRFAKPDNFDAMVLAARDAARAARAAGANTDTIVASANAAAFQVAGLPTREDTWTTRADLA